MNPNARSALTLAVLLVLPQLQALCPRLAPDVISGKVIPCRYLCIKINFLELPSIILSTERDGVLCSTLLLRRRGVCRNGGCIPFGSDDEIKPKGALGKVIAAIDKFASGSYRQKAPTPGTPFGPIVSTATSLFGGGSSTTSGGTSNTASSIVATATAAAVGSTFKNLFSGSTSGSSENSRRNERPPLNPYSHSLPSIPEPAHQPNTAGGTLPSGSSAVPVTFGGGPPSLPPSTEGGTETEGTQAAPGTPSMNSRGHSEHPALAPFPSPPPPKPKGSLNSGSASDASNSGGNVIKTAIGIVLGNLRGMSASSTSSIPSGQQTSGGPIEGLKRSFVSSVPSFPKSTSVPQKGLIKEISGGSGATPTAFQFGRVPPIVPLYGSSGAESDDKERLRRLADSANPFQAGSSLTAPAAPTVTNVEYNSKPPTITPPQSRSPSIKSVAPDEASRSGSSARSRLKDTFGGDFTTSRGISPGATRNTLPEQPSSVAPGETLKPSTRSSIIEGASNAPATSIPTEYSSSQANILPLSGRFADSEHEKKSQRPGASKVVQQPISAGAEAVEVSTVTGRGPSLLPTSNPPIMTPPTIGAAPLERPPASPQDRFSGSQVTKSIVTRLNSLIQVPASATPIMPPSSAVPNETPKPSNNAPIQISQTGINGSEVKHTKHRALGALQYNPTHGAVKLGAGKTATPLSTVPVAENAGSEASRLPLATNSVLQPAVIAEKISGASITNLQGSSLMSTNKLGPRPMSFIGRAGLELPAASRPTSAVRNRMKKPFVRALNPLKNILGSTTSITSITRQLSAVPDSTSKPRAGASNQSLQKGTNGPELKSTDETKGAALQGNPTHAAVKLGGGPPSIPPSTVGGAENNDAEASRQSSAPSTALRPVPIATKTAAASITLEHSPPQISFTKPGHGPPLSIGSAELESAAASQSRTSARQQMKENGEVLGPFRRTSESTNTPDSFRQTSQSAAGVTPKPSNSSSQGIHKGARIPKVKYNTETAAQVLPSTTTPKNAQFGSGTTQVPPPITGAANITTTGTSPPSADQNGGLVPVNGWAETSKAGITNMKNSSQDQAGKPVLKSAAASQSSNSTETRVEKAFKSTLSAMRQISKSSTLFMPRKKASLVTLNEKIKPISSLNKDDNSPKKPRIQVGNKRPPHASVAMDAAPVGEHPTVVQAPTKKGAKSGSPEDSEQPAAPALRPVNVMEGTAGSGITEIGTHTPPTSSTASKRPLASTKTAPVAPITFARTSGSLESPLQNRLASVTVSPPKEPFSDSDGETPKQSNGPQAHSSQNTMRPRLTKKSALNISEVPLAQSDASFTGGASISAGGELGEKNSHGRMPTSSNTITGTFERNVSVVNAPRPARNPTRSSYKKFAAERMKSGGVSQPPTETKKSSTGEPSHSGSDLENSLPVTGTISGIRRSKLERQKNTGGSQFAHNHISNKGVASLFKDSNSKKEEIGALANSNVQRTTLSGLSVAAARATPTNLSTSSNTSERSSSSGGSNSLAIKSVDVGTRIPQNNIPNVVTNIVRNHLLKRKENLKSLHDERPSPKTAVVHVHDSSHGVVTAKVIEGRNSFSVKERQSNFPSRMPPESEIGSASGSIASSPSIAKNASINAPLGSGMVRDNKESAALGHQTEKKIPTIPPSDSETTNRNLNNPTQLASANQSNSNSPSSGASTTSGSPGNIVLPGSKAPATHGSTSAAVTGMENVSSGIPSTLHSDTIATQLKPTATPGSASNANLGNRLVPKSITATANQAPVVTPVSKSSNSAGRRNMGTDTNGLSNEQNNEQSTRKSNEAKNSTLSQITSRSNGRYESNMSSGTDASSTAESTSPAKDMDGTSNFASRKRDSSSTSPPLLTATTASIVSSPLSGPSASSLSDASASSPLAGTFESTSEKHTPTPGSLPGRRGSLSLGRAADNVQTVRPSPSAQTYRNENAGNHPKPGSLAGLNSVAASRVSMPNLGPEPSAAHLENTKPDLKYTRISGPSIERGSDFPKPQELAVAAPSSVPKSSLHARLNAQNKHSYAAPSASVPSVPSAGVSPKAETLNPSPVTTKNEATKEGNTPTLPPALAVNSSESLVSQNVQTAKPTTAGKIVHNISAPTSKDSAVSASTNGEIPTPLAGTSDKTTNLKIPPAPTSLLSGKQIASSESVSPNITLKPSETSSVSTGNKLSSHWYRLRSAFKLRAGARNATRTKEATKPSEEVSTPPLLPKRNMTSLSSISNSKEGTPSGPAVPNPATRTSTEKTKDAVNESGRTGPVRELPQPTVSENPSSPSTFGASRASETNPIIHHGQPSSPLGPVANPLGRFVFGSRSGVPGGFWGPSQALPRLFQPF